MFDFFKDMGLQYHGVDLDAVKEIEQQRKYAEKEERVLLPKSFKKIVYVMGGIYLAVAVLALMFFRNMGAAVRIELILMITMDVMAIVGLMLKTKRSEIIGLVGVGGFFVVLIVFTMLM